MKKCLQCNGEFTPKNPKGKFCSDKCKMAHWRAANEIKKTKKKFESKKREPKNIEIKKATVENDVIIAIPKNLDELKKMCPSDLVGLDRSVWIGNERQKYKI